MEKIVAAIVVCCSIIGLASAQLKVGFYNSSCSRAESLVREAVQQRFKTDRSISAALLRMHFHDCFVRGCDASILIHSETGDAEKDAFPNETVRGYDLIDTAKKAVEAACPSTVSCADIITLATRDAVALAGGPKYDVPTGRRDGLASDITEDRLANFRGSGKPDPTMDPGLAARLRKICGTGSDPAVFLDQGTAFVMDNQFYNQILLKRGILEIDQRLARDRATGPIVAGFAANGTAFQRSFAMAMVKLSKTGVLVGKAGEIRKNCRAFNPKRGLRV
ncbi:hypothetical protein SASPL_112133 [Salvia splendens]|uniref:peroxidase n=1 Tax=Salvia splendens TaxID=180675 RepID=A0A8X9A4Z8_SALSN|nr:hypothetical protein SASPL_112133 [Salvia splendens]